MDAADILRRARARSGLSLRALAERSATSHATLSAYEAGRVVPRVDTLQRILRAAGYSADVVLRRRPDATPGEREAKGRELVQVLDLAGHFPARHAPTLEFPPFPPSSQDR
jgi:transcriptional regulator with XRE-family HTH domain